MAASVVERAWRASAPDTVERDLAALWRDLARHGAIARAVMSNLVVFRLHERRAVRRAGDAAGSATDTPTGAFDELLDSVVSRHPSRAIVIEHDRGDHDPCAPIGANVGVSVFGPPSAKYAVEWVVVRSACAGASLPSIVRRYIRGDVPTSIWWTEDVSYVPPLRSLVATGRQLVYDSRGWRNILAGIGAVAPLLATGINVADLNWPRLAHLRLALVHSSASIPSKPSASQMQIAHRPGEEALAWLLGGWIAARLGWAPSEWPTMSEGRPDGDVLSLRIEGEASVTATLDDHRVRLEHPGAPPLVAAVPRPALGEAIAAELRALSMETAFHDAVMALARRMAWLRTGPASLA